MAMTFCKSQLLLILSSSILIVSNTSISPDINDSRKVIQPGHLSYQGRKLRNYVGIPESNRLDSGVEFSNHSSVDMWCSIPKNSREKIKECYIISPDGSRYLKNDKSLNISKENDSTSEWYPSVDSNIIIIMPKDKKQCKVVIDEVKRKDSK